MVAMPCPTLPAVYVLLDPIATVPLQPNVLLAHGLLRELAPARYVPPGSMAQILVKVARKPVVCPVPADSIKTKKARRAATNVLTIHTKWVMTTACVLVSSPGIMDATSKMVRHPILLSMVRPKVYIMLHVSASRAITAQEALRMKFNAQQAHMLQEEVAAVLSVVRPICTQLQVLQAVVTAPPDLIQMAVVIMLARPVRRAKEDSPVTAPPQ